MIASLVKFVGALVLSLGVVGCAGTPAAPAAGSSLPASQFAGVWEALGSARKLGSDPVLTAQALEKVNEQTRLRQAGSVSGDVSANCIPPAMPTMTTFGVHELLVDKKKITWIVEYSNGLRWIFLDGRQHPPAEELRPTTNGHSIGHMEGDELVVETVGFMDASQVYVGRPGNESIFPSPDMRVVERIRLAEGGRIMINDRVIYDPASFVEPWKTTVRYERRNDFEIGEIICTENNRSDEY